MRSPRSALIFLVSGLLILAACSEDPPTAVPDAGTDAGVPDDPDAGMTSCVPTSLPPLAEGEWDPQFTIAGFTGQDGLVSTVYDFAADTDGSLLVAGRFEYVGRERVTPLVRGTNGAWENARTEWPGTPPSGGFSAVAVGPAGELAVSTGDAFGDRQGEIWIDEGNGVVKASPFQGLVRRMVWFDGMLWVAGDFVLDEAPTAPFLAVWDGTSWGEPPGGSADAPAYTVHVHDNSLWVGGVFSNIGGKEARRIAQWIVGTGWVPQDIHLAEAAVYALAHGEDGTLYAGGAMFNDPSTGRGGIARSDGESWELLDNGVSNGFAPGVVSDLLIDQGKLYVTGCFKTVGGNETDVGSLPSAPFARWSEAGWESLADGTKPVGSPWYRPPGCGDDGPRSVWNMEYQRLFKHGDAIYLGGGFPGVDGVASQSLIAFENDAFVVQGAPEMGVVGAFEDLAVGGPECTVYGVGSVTHAGPASVPGRVAFYRDGWKSVESPLPVDGTCSEIEVGGDGTVYLGCSDFSEGLVGRVFKLDGNEWTPVGEPFAEALVMDLARDPDGKLWVAGGAEKGFIARLDGADFTVVEDGFDGMVTELAFKPRTKASEPIELAVAGTFLNIDGAEFSRIARWNGSGWEALGSGLASFPSALEYGVHGIYASAQYDGSPDRITLGRWNGTAWEELATPEHGLPAPIGESVHTFLRLREVGTSLVAVGAAWPETGGRNAFVFDGETGKFSVIGDGVNAGEVPALAVTTHGIWMSGTIAETGTGASRQPSVGVARFHWPSR